MYMHSFACILACVAALSPAFQRTADSGVLWNAGLRAPTHATMHVYHACTILHIISDVHAACHGACAHVERAREAEIRLGPGSEEAWPAAQAAYRCAFSHAVFFAYHAIQFPICSLHGMQYGRV